MGFSQATSIACSHRTRIGRSINGNHGRHGLRRRVRGKIAPIIPQTRRVLQRTECTLGILAGGPGKRAGVRDKGLMVVDGRLLIERTIQQQGETFAEVLACCRDNAHVYRHFSDRVFCESRAGEGPLLGLAALLAATETPLLAVVPCDQLVLPTCWLNTLMDNLPDGAAGVLLGEANRHTPVGLWRSHPARNLVDALISQGVRALGALAKEASVGLVEAPGSGRDADTIADLQGEKSPR